MKVTITCPRCDEKHALNPEKIPDKGGKITCRTCSFIIPVTKELIEEEEEVAEAKEGPKAVMVECPQCGHSFEFTPPAPSEKEKERKTILLVEDQEFFITFTKEILEKRYTVLSATTVSEALGIFDKERVDLILLDLVLKDEDGREFLKQIKKKCPILIYTSKDEMEMYGNIWSDLRKLGADDVIYKGMNVEDALFLKLASFFGEKLK